MPIKAVESLPNRPLRSVEAEAIDAVPFSGIAEYDMVFAIMFSSEERAYGFGFDEDRDEWIVLADESRENESEALQIIDTAINEWVESKYGERYGNEQIPI